MSFLRHTETHQKSLIVRGRDYAATPSLIVLMSLQLAIPGRLLPSRACVCFTNRRLLCNNLVANCNTAFAGIWTPTLTGCLTLGVHRNLNNPPTAVGGIPDGSARPPCVGWT